MGKFVKGGSEAGQVSPASEASERGRAPSNIEVGFFPEDKHEPTGLPVAHDCGTSNEFGVLQTVAIPETTFFQGLLIRGMESGTHPCRFSKRI